MKLGCQVDVASNGLLATDLLKDKEQPKYDIILLDLEMPIKGETDVFNSAMSNVVL